MTLCVFVLIASEFMPVSLLTPITRDLGVTEGLAGQGIAISGALAVLTSLTLSTLAGKMNRKFLQLGMTVLMAVSGLIIALASSYLMYMVGRAMIGVAIGGFWSMSAATAIRLVPQHQVTRALAIFNAGNGADGCQSGHAIPFSCSLQCPDLTGWHHCRHGQPVGDPGDD